MQETLPYAKKIKDFEANLRLRHSRERCPQRSVLRREYLPLHTFMFYVIPTSSQKLEFTYPYYTKSIFFQKWLIDFPV